MIFETDAVWIWIVLILLIVVIIIQGVEIVWLSRQMRKGKIIKEEKPLF